MKSTDRNAVGRLFNLYSSLIEYTNNIRLPHATCVLLVCLQSLCMSLQHIRNLVHSSSLIDFLELLGILKQMQWVISGTIEVSQATVLVLSIIIFILLVATPLYAITVAIRALLSKDMSKLSKKLENSAILCIISHLLVMYQYIFVPLATPICTLIIIYIEGVSRTFCIASLILIIVMYCLIEYHQLELDPQLNCQETGVQCQLLRRNFPNNLFDGLLVYIHSLLVVFLEGEVSLLVAMGVFLLRMCLSYYAPFYQGNLKRIHTFVQGCSFTFLAALVIARRYNDISLFFLMAVSLMLGLWWVTFKTTNLDYWRIPQDHNNKLEECKLILVKDQTFGHVFRELLSLERQTNSYRQLLLVEALKKRCTRLECASRGGAKIINAEDLIKYEKKMLRVINNFFQISDRSISIFKFMQQRQPKCGIFIQEITVIVKLIAQTKRHLEDMLKVNNKSSVVVSLASMLSKKITNDDAFFKGIMELTRDQVELLTQKNERKRLFNNNSGVIFLSLLQDVGKITRVSRNMMQVLGYYPSDLLGLSINELMPFSIRPHHDDIIINFLKKCSTKVFRSDPYIKFLAYRKEFHLEECVINYSFNMNDFQNFQLSGIFRQAKGNKSVILCDQYGNLEGWTEDVGRTLNLDAYSQAQCRQYNIFVLIPALIKYQNKKQEKLIIQTLIFMPKDQKNAGIRLMDSINRKNIVQTAITEKQVQAFQKMVSNDDFDELKLMHLEMTQVVFVNGLVKFWRIDVKRIESVKNSSLLISFVKNNKEHSGSPGIKNNLKPEIKSNETPSKEEYNSFSHSMENSLKNGSRSQYTQDYVFTDKIGAQPYFETNDIELAGHADLRHSNINNKSHVEGTTQFEASQESSEQTDDASNDTMSEGKRKNKPSGNFQPSIYRTRFTKIFYPLSLLFMALVLYDAMELEFFSKQMISECNKVRNRNSAFMVFIKSSFNPNLTYIKQFTNGTLLEKDGQSDIADERYIVDGKTQKLPRFYLFNVQIPAMLTRLAMTNNTAEIDNNFVNLVRSYDSKIEDDLRSWEIEIESLRKKSTIRFWFIAIESVIYVLYLIYCYHQERRQSKIVDAFFKFQKVDLEHKTKRLRECLGDLERICQECYLSQQLPNILKHNELSNVYLTRSGEGIDKFGSEKQEKDYCKISFEATSEREAQITRRKLISLVLFITIFMIGQVVFLIVYGIMATNMINTYLSVPKDIDDACKLVVEPNLKMASLYRQTPTSVIDKYSKITPRVLASPLEALPKLFPLLQTAPCQTCPYHYPLLATNFISFYSSFNQIVREVKAKNSTNFNLTQLYYAVDIVVAKVRQALTEKKPPIILPLISLYAITLVIFIFAGLSGQNKVEDANNRLEDFLRYFDQETIMKNKHMSNIVKVSI